MKVSEPSDRINKIVGATSKTINPNYFIPPKVEKYNIPHQKNHFEELIIYTVFFSLSIYGQSESLYLLCFFLIIIEKVDLVKHDSESDQHFEKLHQN